MNILTDTPPSEVVVDGKVYLLNTDFRTCLRTILAFEDEELTTQEKQSIVLVNLFRKTPKNLRTAIVEASLFLNGGKKSNTEDEPGPRLYSFKKDASFIYAAFRQTHGIDLTTADLHWWQFLALFMDLGSDTAFCQLTSLRKRVKTGKATKEERQAARDMGELFEIPEPDTRTLDEKEREAEFMRLVALGRSNKE